MRPRFGLRRLRAAHLTIAMIMLAAPSCALAALSGGGGAARAAEGDPHPALGAKVTPRHVALGDGVEVSGRGRGARAGETVELQRASGTHARWQRVATTRIGRGGGWGFRGHLRESARLRAVEVSAAPTGGRTTASSAIVAPPGTTAISRATSVQVKARMLLAVRQRSVRSGHPAAVAGRLLPARAGRLVSVQTHGAGGWRTVGRARTTGRGSFAARVAAPMGASHRLRAVFSGDRLNARVTGGAGSLTTFTSVLVSWYEDFGSNACGFHAAHGVANRTLACGTKVRFRDGGRTVTATVDDRGPYVYPREFDLDQNTAAALGFHSVGTIQASVQ